MAANITRKALLSLCKNRPVIRAGYMEMFYLLRFCTPRYSYTSRTYGWLADIYEINNVVIITGYDTVGPHSPVNPIRHAEDIAEAATADYWRTEECRRLTNKALDDLLRLFRNEHAAVKTTQG